MDLDKIFDQLDGLGLYIFWGILILSWLLPRIKRWLARDESPHTQDRPIEPR